MADLTMNVAGVQFKNPIVVASAEPTENYEKMKLGIDAGASAVIAKSFSPSAEMAQNTNIAKYCVLDENRRPVYGRIPKLFSLYCRTGMIQMSEDEWIEELARTQKYALEKGAEVIGSAASGKIEDLARIGKKMEQIGLKMLEMDTGCPHPDEMKDKGILYRETDAYADATRAVTSVVDIPVIMKLTPQIPDLLGVAKACMGAGAAGVTVHNRFLGFSIDIDTAEPHIWGWGGIGGPWMLPLSLRWVSKIHAADPSIPIFGSNGAYDWEDVVRFHMAGAHMVEFCSAVMVKGYGVITDAIEGLDAFLDDKGYAGVADIVGLATRAAHSYEEMHTLPEYQERAVVDMKACTDCKKCLDICWYHGMERTAVPTVTYVVDDENCKGCRNCQIICPADAVRMRQYA